MSGIHQFVPMLHRGDAVGRHTMRLRDLMVARGIDSRIYVELVDPETEGETLLASSYPEHSQAGDVLLYQFATSSAMAAWLAARRETLVVNYHNITPPELLAPWDNHLALGQLRAQGELGLLVQRAALAVADSHYNRDHLVAAGFKETAVVPPRPRSVRPSSPPPVGLRRGHRTERGRAGSVWVASPPTRRFRMS